MDRTVPIKDGRTVTVRDVQATDAGLFMTFFDGLSAHSRSFMRGWGAVPAARCDREHAARIAANVSSDNYYGLVAVASSPSGERIVGYSWVDGVRGPDIPMLGIGVADEYHEVGLGRALLRLMADEARRRGLDKLKLGVFTHNTRAIHVYELVGFRVDPAIPPQQFDGQTEIYMVLQTGVEGTGG